MTKPRPDARHGPYHSNNKVHWIPKFIREERVRQDLTHGVLGKELGFHTRHIANYETGHYSIRAIYALEKILHALGYELRIHKRIEMNPNDGLKKTAKEFPKTVKVNPDLENSEIRAFFGQGFPFVRASFKTDGYCVLGFKNEYTLTTFCKKFAKYLVSEGNVQDK